ncbi:hypothetical protein VHEMI02225 [[Torrubiella] hemipterigena]|uniref:Hydrophobin n=1 Tax=[Torrubiella] hemipterigena TaxID=1531966 RepID=A0A0A1T7N7_9HYPO|nr:hypothetical protein VHEMI02225 [[Torrubiella] hemipterigena]
MKAFFAVTALTAGFAIATPTEEVVKRDCPALVDPALAASVTALKIALGPFAPANLKDATDAGAACFKDKVGCAAVVPPPPTTPGQLDCGGTIGVALGSAVAALKTGLGPIAPPSYQEGVDAGLTCFKNALGCKPAA